MKKLLIIGLLAIFFPSLAIADSAKDALRALKKLEARCEAGISYKDYAPALGDAKFEVNLFIEAQEAKEKPELAKLISDAMIDYEAVRLIWAKKFSGSRHTVSYILNNDTIYDSILQKYSVANKSIKDGGVLKEVYDPETCNEVMKFALQGEKQPSYCYDRGEYKIDIDRMINFIWATASTRLKDAMRLLANN